MKFIFLIAQFPMWCSVGRFSVQKSRLNVLATAKITDLRGHRQFTQLNEAA